MNKTKQLWELVHVLLVLRSSLCNVTARPMEDSSPISTGCSRCEKECIFKWPAENDARAVFKVRFTRCDAHPWVRLTGSLDDLLCGGFPCGAVTELVGAAASGKTQVRGVYVVNMMPRYRDKAVVVIRFPLSHCRSNRIHFKGNESPMSGFCRIILLAGYSLIFHLPPRS